MVGKEGKEGSEPPRIFAIGYYHPQQGPDKKSFPGGYGEP